ncbi:FAD/NAD(P)-binding protein [Couchioplanes caeruleus]|uniref:FAD/NAD(P)-binding protein n=1 Tax=Couchioplanes caeruleus TaxID=56438 RepID=UPI0020BEC128|nr:FAD/NAD(P)-binding protein [Couchioplanes caeruleus]UQU63862.1 FAD/NAD(P)-binding protein [Couchioplanes caeruleus]
MTVTTARPRSPGGAAGGREPYRLAIVGGGPRATYALERLAATVDRLGPGERLEIRVYERTGEFGAGAVHSARQARTSFLNRTSEQVSFAADETVPGAGSLRPRDQRPSLYEWCRSEYARTGDPDFDVSPTDWPKRHVHGAALTDMFTRFVAELDGRPGVEVQLVGEEVVDIRDDGTDLHVCTGSGQPYPADQVLLVTGHSPHDPWRLPEGRQRMEFAGRHGTAYVPYAYPLDETLSPAAVPPGAVVGCLGMGLTAIDVILHLTEGRGGTFAPGPDGGLGYRPGGREPGAIVACSGAGLFTFTRPDNHKHDSELEHRGTFLTEKAVDRLRESSGLPSPGGRRQLDFDTQVLPLILLEMAHLFATTLYGARVGRHLAARARPGYERFLRGEPAAALTRPIEDAVDEIGRILDEVLSGHVSAAEAARRSPEWPVTGALARWVRVVHGEAAARHLADVLDDPAALVAARRTWPLPSGLDPSARGNRFTWAGTLAPIPADEATDPGRYASRVLAFMDRDLARAAQGNLDNPHKAAADGVWRDLRGVISYAVDDGGLTPASQRAFLGAYPRHHNRLANGAAPEVMARITALVRAGVVDVGTGPGARVECDEDAGRFRLIGPVTGARRAVDLLVDARIHTFDPELDSTPLFRRLAARGLVRRWRNVGADGTSYAPGGLDLTREGHPVRADGCPEPRVTVLGPAAEGQRSFLLSALRPGRDHYVMRDTLAWLDRFWAAYHERPTPAGATPSPTEAKGGLAR